MSDRLRPGALTAAVLALVCIIAALAWSARAQPAAVGPASAASAAPEAGGGEDEAAELADRDAGASRDADLEAASDAAEAAAAAADAGAEDAAADAAAADELTPAERAYLTDLSALSSGPHRLSGTERGKAAAAYIEQRLRRLGIEQVHVLDMPVWQSRTLRCTLQVGGRTVRLYPLRPNVVVNPVTPPPGVTAPLVYVGSGSLDRYGSRSVVGAIVVLDYDSFDNWERAFALGARAVVFLGGGDETPVEPKHAGVPSNQIRLYAPPAALEQIDLRRDHPEAKVVSEVVWGLSRGRNLIARIPGTDPDFAPDAVAPEALVLAAAYDSFGVVPGLSPGARGAANVAALLEAAAELRKAPPRRDLLLMFLDNQGRAHQGAREVYAALQMPQEEAEQVRRELEQEQAHVTGMRDLLAGQGLGFDAPELQAVDGISVELWLKQALQKEADYARDDVRRQLQALRLEAGGRGETGPFAPRLAQLDALALRWDQVRRALHEGKLRAFVEQHQRSKEPGNGAAQGREYRPIFEALQAQTLARFERRLKELSAELQVAEQRSILKQELGFTGADGATAIVLHVTYALGDQGPKWGVVVGDWTHRLFPWRSPKSEGDTPGFYGGVLGAIREVHDPRRCPNLDADTLTEPTLGLSFAPGPFVSSGVIAGAYGVYNVSLMSGYDRRARDGHPSDTLSHLNWQRLRHQALEATALLHRLADSDAISLPVVFKPLAKNKLPRWSKGQSTGDYAGLVVSGSLAEDRPAAGALVALWPGQKGWVRQAWASLDSALVTPSFDPIALEPVSENGRFRVVSFREDMHSEVMSIGAAFDRRGELLAISTTEQQAQTLTEAMRVNLFFGSAGAWTTLRTHETQPSLLKLLKASSDSFFRDKRALWGQLKSHGFFYISDQLVDYRVKLFQPMGPVALGEFTEAGGAGAGLDPELFSAGVELTARTAADLYNLNESRLDKLRARGVTSADLETLHSRARREREQGEAAKTVVLRHGALARSASLSQRVYLPLRATMDDLVHAIVVLLLLSIPFAFAMERLLICATSIYGRIGGFAGMFLGTFGLLYWLHPGFAIASTPMIVFLAFAIVLLASLVIYIVVRKFRTELRALQGQSAGVHDLEVSRAGTMLAAVSMGMSTMRRRPTRTLLTAVTVVMLTFTILSFASFSRTVGVRSVYEGPLDADTAAGLLVRKLDYSPMPPGTLDMLRGVEGADGLLAPQYWLVREEAEAPRFTVANTHSGKSLAVDAVMGLLPEQLARWPQLAGALGKTTLAEHQQALQSGAVYLPAVMQQVLRLKVGDEVLLAGRRLRFAGPLDGPALQRVRHLDNQSVLPVDFQDPASQAMRAEDQQAEQEDDLLMAEDVDRDFVHLSSDQVAVASAALVRALGGDLHSVMVHPGEGVDIVELGQRVAEVVVMPVWAAGAQGVERLILTVLTEVTGGLALFVPLLLGGLIIFGTLLGSISDREKEIYTFSALGLSPGHVGVLFFAEATVYAIVGGVGGQLLAQLVGLGAAALADAGVIQPISLNCSSTNSLFAIGVVMLTVLVSAIYPALRASRSANPGLARSWKMPPAVGDRVELVFPFTVSAYDITGVVSFLAEHFRQHDDAGLGSFAASDVVISQTRDKNITLSAELALAPFDLGVTQRLVLTALPSEIEGVDEVAVELCRLSGARSDWYRANRVFLRDLRRQFLLWRTLSHEVIEQYRMETLQTLPETGSSGTPPDAPQQQPSTEPTGGEAAPGSETPATGTAGATSDDSIPDSERSDD